VAGTRVAGPRVARLSSGACGRVAVGESEGGTDANQGVEVVASGVFIGLGSNLGDREATIRSALRELEADDDIRVVCCSSLRETEPVGGPPGQGRYLNAVAELETTLSPRALLERLLAIEERYGRERDGPNDARTLDLDLLLYGDRVINEPDLVVPHPRMWERPFVMEPLAEICDTRILKARWKTLSGKAAPRARR
jgi:2-amino-4-hydroxy-6-hydroxymethyldihydropteridine diphosphokinase